jgi:Zn-dependent protease
LVYSLALIYSLLPLLVVFLLLQGTVLLLMYKNLMQTKLRQPRYQLESISSLPSYYQRLFQGAIAFMEPLGFEQVSALRVQKMVALDLEAEDRVLWFYHPERATYAEVDLRFPIEGTDVWNISLINYLSDGQWLLTLNGQIHGVIGAYPRTILQDSYSPDLETQWKLHCDRLLRLPEPLVLSPEQFAEKLEQFYASYFEALAQKRLVKRSGDSFYLRPLCALRTAWQVKLGTSKVAKRRSQRQHLLIQRPDLQVEVPLEIQALGFHRLRAMERGGRQLKWGKWFLLGSLALFLALGYALPHSSGLFLNGPGWVLNLMFVLVFHELGHFGAMKLFGYQDVTMFFLPLMGAAVSGRKVDASLAQKVWMLLAGPMPGLILGFGLLVGQGIWPQVKALESLAWMLIGLNLANLLPILPLDGGKIAHLVLFSRFPSLDVLFRGVGVVFLGLLGVFGSPLLLALALAVAIGIPNSYRTARLDRDLRNHVRTNSGLKDPDDILITAFRQMRSAGYDGLPFAKRDAMAKELLERFHEGKASILQRWLLGGLYSLALLGGGAGTIAILSPWRSTRLAAVVQSESRLGAEQDAEDQRAARRLQNPRAEIASHTALLKRQPQNQVALVDRAQAYARLGQLAQARQDLDALIKLNSQRGDYYLQRASLRHQLKDYKGAIADANAALDLNTQNAAAYEIRSYARQALGDSKTARSDFQKSQTLRDEVAP